MACSEHPRLAIDSGWTRRTGGDGAMSSTLNVQMLRGRFLGRCTMRIGSMQSSIKTYYFENMMAHDWEEDGLHVRLGKEE